MVRSYSTNLKLRWQENDPFQDDKETEEDVLLKVDDDDDDESIASQEDVVAHAKQVETEMAISDMLTDNRHAVTIGEELDVLRGKRSRHNDTGTSCSLPMEALDLPTAAQVQARAVALMAQTEMSGDIPGGVTVLPSGKWRTLVYFKGQSRYLGVFTDSSEAAMAWVVARKVLKETNVKGATREEITKWFCLVRNIVTGLVLGASFHRIATKHHASQS